MSTTKDTAAQASRLNWQFHRCLPVAEQWRKRQDKNRLIRSENSLWWHFPHNWVSERDRCIQEFIDGNYQFSPMTQWNFKDSTVIIPSDPDRLVLRLLLDTVRPLIPHIISTKCHHLAGPSAGVRQSLTELIHAMKDIRVTST